MRALSDAKFQQQKRKLIADFEEEKHLLTQSFKIERQSDGKTHQCALELVRSQLVQEKSTYESKINELKTQHAHEVI